MKGWREEGVVSPIFFCKPPNGLHFQIAKLELCPHPINLIWEKKSQVCLTVICTTHDFGNCYNPQSSKAKGPSEFSKESRIGGGAVEQGSRERKQNRSSAGNAHESQRCAARGCGPGYGGVGAREPGSRAGEIVLFSGTILVWSCELCEALFLMAGSPSSLLYPCTQFYVACGPGPARRLQNGRAPYGFPQLLRPAQLWS